VSCGLFMDIETGLESISNKKRIIILLYGHRYSLDRNVIIYFDHGEINHGKHKIYILIKTYYYCVFRELWKTSTICVLYFKRLK